jgi:hypothetical protein
MAGGIVKEKIKRVLQKKKNSIILKISPSSLTHLII